MNKQLHILLTLTLAILLVSCGRQYSLQDCEVSSIQITDSLAQAHDISALIAPYKQKMETEMNEVLVFSNHQMEKAQPESLLGNFLSKLIQEKCGDYMGQPIDFGIVNYGGIRIPSLPAGEITKGKVFELMPFDNFLVVLTINGETVNQLANHMAAVGGWPVSGIRFKIVGGKATEILINQKPVVNDKKYTLAITDYLADGGDKLDFLVDKPRYSTGVFMRDAIIEYLKALHDEGKSISCELDGRVEHAQ